MKMLNWWRSLRPAQQYSYAMLSAGLGLLPLFVCRIFDWEIPAWLLFPCLIVSMSASSLAYAIRVNNT